MSGRRSPAAARLAGAAMLLVAALAPAPTPAQDGVEVADRVGVELSAGAAVDPAAPVFDLAASRFLGDRVRLGVRQEGGFAASAGRDGWHLATLPFVDLHLLPDPKPLASPFVGLAAGALYDDDRVTAALGPEAGVDLFLSEHLYLTLRWQFRWTTGAVGDVGRESHVATLGVGWLFPAPVDEQALRTASEAAARAEQAAIEAERAVERLEKAVERLERAVDAFAEWYLEQLRKR
ncbi:MAG: hypothetical protein AB1689_19355 [Thermodesulfobacteriota bacterium]